MEKDASHRLLQPTFNTSTRSAVGVPLVVPLPHNLAAGGVGALHRRWSQTPSGFRLKVAHSNGWRFAWRRHSSFGDVASCQVWFQDKAGNRVLCWAYAPQEEPWSKARVQQASPARHYPPSGERATSSLAPLSPPPASAEGELEKMVAKSPAALHLVKGGECGGDQGAFPQRVLSPLHRRSKSEVCTCAPATGQDHRESATKPTVWPPWPGFKRRCPNSTRWSREGGWAVGWAVSKKDLWGSFTRLFHGPRTEEEGRTGRFSSRSAFQSAYEHNHGRVRSLADGSLLRRW